MRAIIYDFSTDIFLDDKEIHDFCKVGCGKYCCVWLILGEHGFMCSYHNKPFDLVERFRKGETNAKRDGCAKVKEFVPSKQESSEVEF